MKYLVVVERTTGISSSEIRKSNLNTFEEFRKIESLGREREKREREREKEREREREKKRKRKRERERERETAM